jgi:vitamin B12 transporter
LFFPNFGNPQLDAEISDEWNAGVEQTLWGQRFSLEVAYFSRRVKGLIESVLIDPDNFIFQAQNKGRVDVQGVEVIPVLRVLPGLTLSGNFTFLDFDTQDGKLLRRPTEHGSFIVNYERRGLSWSDDLLNLHLNVNVVGDRDDVDPVRGPQTNPMFARTNFAATYSFAPGFLSGVRLAVYTRVENLFDREYEEVLGFRSPPLNYIVGMRVTF